jgi:DNA modification methylase
MASAWPADKVERRPVAALIPYARNARIHSPEQISQIASSIAEFGFTVPVLIDEAGCLIAGHGRLLAAQKLGLNSIPALVAKGWSAAKKRAYVIADNKLALNGEWDLELLKVELSDLEAEKFDLMLTGFGADELSHLMLDTSAGLTDPDEAPDAPVEPVSVPGDVWLLGKHRLVCGDCTDAGIVEKALNGVKPHLMVTDPPYGVNYDPVWRDKAAASGKLQRFGKNVGVGLVGNDNNTDWREAWYFFPGDVAYCWHAGLHASNTQLAFEACGFALRSQIIWAKSHFVIGRGDYHVQHEPCFYLVRKSAKGHWSGDRTQSTVWQIDKPQKSETGHSTQKPIECMKRPIENNSSPGQAVYDPFVGSGTTIIAAEMTGRACHAIELNPSYCDVSITRWMNFTGKEATLEATGQTFAETVATRMTGQSEPSAGSSMPAMSISSSI